MKVVAVTGATGFVGRHLVAALARAGWRVRLLMRRDPVVPEWRGVEPQIIAGDLRDPAALEALVEGVDHVVHVAGLIKAARREAFFAVNVTGSLALAQAMVRRAPAAGLLHVSTIAAREPQLSDYAASKRAGEDAVRRVLGARATVIRPPAVYGPGDPESLAFFKLARGSRVPLAGPPAARAALIHVADLVSLMTAMLDSPDGGVWSAADAHPEGYTWREVLAAAAAAVGNPDAKLFQAPMALLRTIALAGDVGKLFGSASMLNSLKLRELRHPDWSVPAAQWARPAGWSPRFDLAAGFADAVAWYRNAGWLPAR
ncbi:MAG TPA: SDR family NAD(P)-dependent oxidoreductase [Steroidobacteraceae bacterium]|nr:SDR family NAD(P)-dependent oxidoreductase [Steroidobacteraceae bacterium]